MEIDFCNGKSFHLIQKIRDIVWVDGNGDLDVKLEKKYSVNISAT